MDLVVDNLGYDIWEDDIPQSSSPIWILGRKYDNTEIDQVRDKINSILWLSYRKGFQPIVSQTASSYQYTSDKGFGCMIRCSQMLIAETLHRIHLPESWNWTPDTTSERYLDIVNRFEDSPEAAYSIQRMALAGEESGKSVSNWFGPNEISQILKNLVPLDKEFSQFTVHVALDSQLAINEIAHDFKPTLIIIPLRLGLGEINTIYINSLKKCLELKSSMGIIGGRPNQALYFFGYLDDDILYHDPHVCQRSGSVGRKQNQAEVELDETYHKRSPGRMAFMSMDPSIAVSFFCKTSADFDELIEQLKSIKDEKNPIFEVVQSRTDFSRDFEHDLDVICGDQHSADKADGEQSDDDFEIIL